LTSGDDLTRGGSIGTGGRFMARWFPNLALAATLLGILAGATGRAQGGTEGGGRVAVVRTPPGTFQPQAVADADGNVHLVVLKGDPGSADIEYTSFPTLPVIGPIPPSIRVNSQPGSAIGVGTIRGVQIALGRDGRLHVVWNGSEQAEPKNGLGGTPLLYTRSNLERTAFESQRNLMTRTSVLDGGGTVASDTQGNVHVAWHGSAEDDTPGEAGRKLWVVRSTDDGVTFSDERPALETSTGACGCCGVKAMTRPGGGLAVLFRTAESTFDRNLVLATSEDHGARFRLTPVSPWRIKTCPMSRAATARTAKASLVAWETENQVSFARLEPSSGRPLKPVTPPGQGQRKHPAIAANEDGEVLLAWTEGTGWKKGGDLVWQIFDATDRPTAERGRVVDGIPVWGVPAVITSGKGFVLIH
jgi:hypothetical protein